MSISYKTGRGRTLRLLMSVTVGGAWTAGPFGGSSPGQTLGTGSSYTTVLTATEASDRGFNAFSSGLGVFCALGTKGSTIGGNFNAAIGVVVPHLTGNGFVPLVLVTAGATATFTVSVTLDRNLPLEERLDHANNGKRWDVYGAAGTCTETYTVHAPGGDVAFTSGTGTLISGVAGGAFPPGGTVGWDSFGLDLASVGGGAFTAYSKAGGAAAEALWSGGFVDSHGDPLYSDPTVPTNTGTGGSTRWGKVATRAPLTGGVTYNYAQATVQWMPRHAFNVKSEPRALPDGRPLVQQHRVEYDLVSPIGGSGASSGYTLYSSGETVTFTSGGAKWLASLTGEGGFSVTYDDFLPVLSRVKVTHNDAHRHYFCHVRSPFSALSLAQQQTMPIPGCSSLSVSSGTTQTVSVGKWLGYRFLRVRAHAVSGTGTLSIGVRLNGATSDTETASLTSTSGSTEEVEIDLVGTPGLTTTAPLTLTSLRFSASGAAFVVDSVEGFVKYSSCLVSCGLRRGLYYDNNPANLPGSESTPWIQGYTDGVLSLQAPSFDGSNPVGWWSQSVRQLVGEINGTTLHSYGSWSTSEPLTFVQAGGTPPAPSSLTGWSASDGAPPAIGKGYGTDEVYNPADLADSDVYVSALHGDGLVYGSPLVGATLL